MWSGPRPHSAGFSAGISWWSYLINQTVMITRYLRLALWPRWLVLNYGWPVPLALGDVVPYAAFILALFVLTLVALIRWPRIGFLGAFFFITLAPTSSIVPIATEVGAERRMYLPLTALATLAVVAAARVPRFRGSIVAALALATVSVALAGATLARNGEYASSLLLARTVVERYPTSVGHHMFGAELSIAGNHQEAIAELRRALPGAPRAHYTLGIELFNQGALPEAIDELTTFVREQPLLLEAVSAQQIIGQAYVRQQRWPEAINHYQEALKMAP
jgi:tetratricopeptide (TPR) repeat protein